MRSSRWYIVPVLILSVAFLPAVGSLAGPDQPAAAPSVPADESDRPLYAPPKKLIPRARVGGEMRGTDGADPEVQPLAPDHVGFTTDRTPTVNWFLSKPTSHKIVFTFTDSRVIRPLYEAQIPTPKSAGIQSVHLKDLGLILETEVQYRWYVSVQRDPDSPSRDIVAGGVIERCDIGECLTTGAVLSCDQHAVVENARNGLWYDAMACLCSLIDRAPADHSLRKLRARLLQDVGLPGVAEWDLRAIQSMNR